MNTGWLTATGLASALVAVPPLADLPRIIIWNASLSVPIGLYAVGPATHLEVTDLVVVEPPEPLATRLAEGVYLPHGVRLMKRVLALPGQTVCRDGLVITVDGLAIGTAREHDSRGRPLPVWQGCRTLRRGDVFLMNWQSGDSFDGRYFGVLPRAAIIGRATPLITDEDGDGQFHWRAATR
ncbi:MAG: S26 family signal peptidase [Bacteroidales bacterium]|nr:S26 family signal peptidase [Bacteroidales bacterium]